MSSPERRKQLQLEFEERLRRDEIERCRRASLSMYERIEEFVQDDELKNILHTLAEKCGLEDK